MQDLSIQVTLTTLNYLTIHFFPLFIYIPGDKGLLFTFRPLKSIQVLSLPISRVEFTLIMPEVISLNVHLKLSA